MDERKRENLRSKIPQGGKRESFIRLMQKDKREIQKKDKHKQRFVGRQRKKEHKDVA
jgi:hypothetical protein